MGEDDSAFDKKKSHRDRHSGRKADKKKLKKDAENAPQELSDKQRNPKAFAFNSAVRAERRFRRKQDIQTKKQHIPVIDRTPVEPPPILIAIVGPPKVGKSTVINNLIRLFTKSPLTDIKGPVTIVTGKKRRITLIECNNDINSMIDTAKVADLVLLLCDASFGFEMEIFEFLNICQVHGMPRIMGVLTHLDMIKNNKTLKNTKKVLKHRFWTEVYPGAKLFYLSGIVHGEYLRNEIKNLGRFISIIKFRPLTWRTTHSYLLGDRYEDLTNQELIRQNPKCDRNISLYGYVRGVPLVKNTSVHIAGLGDLKIHDISYLPDPCPLPDVIKKRSLVEKEKLIYAPFSGVGGIVYDKDAVYVELGGSHSHKKDQEVKDESKNLVSNLIDTKETLDVKMQHSEMQIFTGGKKLTAEDFTEYKKVSTKSSTTTVVKNTVDSDLDEELDELRKDYSGMKEETIVHSGRTRRKVIFEQNDESFAENLSNQDSSDEDEGYDNKNTEYTVLKENKDKDVHNKVANALKYLEKKKPQTSDLEEENSNEESDDEDEDTDEESDVPDDISLESGESLVGVTKMKKKEKIVDIEELSHKKKNKQKSSRDDKTIQEDKFEDEDNEKMEISSNKEEICKNLVGVTKIKKEKIVDTEKISHKKKNKHKSSRDDKTIEEDDFGDKDNEKLEISSNKEEFGENLVGVTQMKKEKIVDIEKISHKKKNKHKSSRDDKTIQEDKFEDEDNEKMEISSNKEEIGKNLVGLTKMKKEKIVDIEKISHKKKNKHKSSRDDKTIQENEFGNKDNEKMEISSNKEEFGENLVGITKMKKEKIVDIEKISHKKKNKHKSSRDDKTIQEDKFDDEDNEEIEIFSNKEDMDVLDEDPNELNLQNNEYPSESSSSDEEDMAVKWKENLAKKARDAFLDRQRTTQNIMKLVYGVFDKHNFNLDDDSSKEPQEDDDIGGLFRVVSSNQKRKTEEKEKMNLQESSLFNTWDKEAKDWLNDDNKILIQNCFVTGKWKQSEDASELLQLDDMKDFSDDDSEIFGDFEDLETGEKHVATPQQPKQGEKRKLEEETPQDKEALMEKKRKLKEKFDSEYDNTENTSYYDDLKTTAEKQAQINKQVFEDMPDDLRVQIEGFRAGMYVRIEFQDVPSEFITNFDPTYPIVIGALNIGEENIGYVNVKIKKHRWYKKILKTADPIIVSLGWRRFQTIPLFSKLEDDLKYRYLKYTPEHVNCNAHFWGPITPQGSGFIALQTVDNRLENVKQLGFRIAATGSVQELEKSTQIMKKLKLIGHPMKIFKKTAFIKDMFNSALEVAKFEGARIKTVSGIRGQIKKAVSKPEGCFRATFEDKILLSDIVFCRTWYKVDVPKFYCPVTTLLLPQDKKNAWRGIRTTGEIKREKGVKNEPNFDSLYTPIEREEKPSKPLVIPRKLQKVLPYRDKPKFAPLKQDLKPNIEKKRVAVVREPHEQKVAKMLKMLRASYEHKQAQLKEEMAKRMSRHQAEMAIQEAKKQQREKRERKEIFRKKSKAKIREEKKGGKK